MDYTSFVETIEASSLSPSMDARSLYAAFAQVSDGRKRRGKQYPLALFLTLLTLARARRVNDRQRLCPVDPLAP